MHKWPSYEKGKERNCENILDVAINGRTFAALVPPSLFTMLKSGDVFIFMGMATSFHKHYCSPSQIIDLLQNRGLLIDDTSSATRQITNIGHYRFSAYLYPLLATPKENQTFKPQSKFLIDHTCI